MAIKVSNLIIGDKQISSDENGELNIQVKNTQEEGTVVINGKPKKFNKNMSAYMIDMLTSEE